MHFRCECVTQLAWQITPDHQTVKGQTDSLGKASKKTFFLGDLPQMWVGWVADSQTRSKPLKKKQIAPKIAFFDPNFTFRFHS